MIPAPYGSFDDQAGSASYSCAVLPYNTRDAQDVAAEDSLNDIVTIALLDQSHGEQGPVSPCQAGMALARQRTFGPEGFLTWHAPLAFGAFRDFRRFRRCVSGLVEGVGADGNMLNTELLN